MYRYKIKLVLFEGPDVVATAMDTKLNAERAECIEVQTAESRCLIELSNIHSLEPLTDNAKFGLVVLNPSAASSYSLA